MNSCHPFLGALLAVRHVPTLSGVAGDARDYHAMRAREAFKVRAARVESHGVTPVDLLAFELDSGLLIREILED